MRIISSLNICVFSQHFLRLNYLDMHRTYGCSSNPGRARPLCNLCGKKFCQPQKLKIHMKRMHARQQGAADTDTVTVTTTPPPLEAEGKFG
jgi:hypothetical protein